MTFAQQLKTARRSLALTQDELAALLEVPARTYWEWESGKTEPAKIAQEGAMARIGRALEAHPSHYVR